jgi:oxygen-independent coproporphyrinogen-3 oxidase
MGAAGLYIHIPFCVSKCPYCDFFSTTDTALLPAFIAALFTEMKLTRRERLTVDTLFLGGGTPSVLAAPTIGRVIENARRFYVMDPAAEITMEVNPGTVTMNRLEGYRRAGVNRLNIGVQSFNSKVLRFLKRRHTTGDNHDIINWALAAKFENIGFDLMYGIPGQTKRSWLADLEQAVAYEPQHLSCYMLTFEPGTPLDHARLEGRFELLAEAEMCDLYETTRAFLAHRGYAQYEISNFAYVSGGTPQSSTAAPNQSRHNLKYWSFAPYRGLGPSAHSYLASQRFWNHADVKRYIRDLAGGRLPISGRETLNREQMMTEAVYLGLRQTSGIVIDVFNDRFEVSFYDAFGDILEGLAQNGLVCCSPTHCALTPKGMLLLDGIAALFV